MKRRAISALIILITCFLLIVYAGNSTKADTNPTYNTYNPSAEIYETDNSYQAIPFSTVDEFCYGAESLGSLRFKTAVYKVKTVDGIESYETTSGNIRLEYYIPTLYCFDDADEGWISADDNTKEVVGISLKKNIDSGTILVQKSHDRVNWESVYETNDVIDEITDKGSKTYVLHTLIEDDLKQGAYIRVLVAYKLRHKIHNGDWTPWDNNKYEYRYCLENYFFYVCARENFVRTVDIEDRSIIFDNGTCDYGFAIKKNGSNCNVTLRTPSGSVINVEDNQTITSKGKYTLIVRTPLNYVFEQTITVTKGLKKEKVLCRSYESEDNKGYPTGSDYLISPSTYCNSPYSEVYVATAQDERVITKGAINRTNVGVKSEQAMIVMRLDSSNLKSNYSIVSDDYGQYDSHSIDGKYKPGKIESGCLIVTKRSSALDEWGMAEDGQYKDGLYTTNYMYEFGEKGDVVIYIPTGEDINNGIYIKVLYAFEVYNSSTKKYTDVVEEHNFYLCSDDVDAVTFHNESTGAHEQLTSMLEGEDNQTIDLYKKIETLTNNSSTSSYFTIDTSNNKTASVSVKRNGEDYEIISGNKVIGNGKYDITVTSKLGTIRKLTIYINKATFDDLNSLYFSNAFIVGKRIYDTGDYPVYEGGLTTYNINGVDLYHERLWGTITNETTGSTTSIESGIQNIQKTITEAGKYTVIFNTNSTYNTNTPAGDNYKIKFQFVIRPEGTAPGPVVNKGRLSDFNNTLNVSNLRPTYYGLTYHSASKGNITYVFADRKTARDYAYKQEQDGCVEKQADGYYRYKGPLLYGQKVLYDDNWDLQEAIYKFIDTAIQKLYFDVSDDFTYRTLPADVAATNSNPRQLELDKSVVFIVKGEEDKLKAKTDIPIINSKKAVTINPGTNGYEEYVSVDFQFVSDTHGYDSYSVKIIDSDGNEYPIQYRKSVEAQLTAYGFKTGIITIVESTVYGDTTTYNALFISENDNTQEATIEYYNNNTKQTQTVTQLDDGLELDADKFSISSIIDNIDSYSLVTIKRGDEVDCYCIDENYKDKVWYEAGEYLVTFVNRYGYKFSIKINISENLYIRVFIVDDNDNKVAVGPISIYGKIELEEKTRYGYEFVGYIDSYNRIHNGSVNASDLFNNEELKEVWKPKVYKISLIIDGKVVKTIDVQFGQEVSISNLVIEGYDNIDGWILDGEQIENLKITEEGNITLEAKLIEAQEEEIPEEQSPEEEETKSKKKLPGWAIALIVIASVLAVAGIVVFIVLKICL